MISLNVIILAAGKGTRMRSALPKVLHELADRPLFGHVIGCVRALEASAVHVIYGHGGEAVPARFPDAGVDWVLQAEQHGTGHAVMQAMPQVDPDSLRRPHAICKMLAFWSSSR